jgi:hypothetical protein
MSDEALRLLEDLVAYIEEMATNRFVPRPDKRLGAARAFLAQPIPAAREAVLEEALRAYDYVDSLLVTVEVAEGDELSDAMLALQEARGCADDMRRDALADTPSAAAALLAQGEALKFYADEDNWGCQATPVHLTECYCEVPADDGGERARAALSGEEKE